MKLGSGRISPCADSTTKPISNVGADSNYPHVPDSPDSHKLDDKLDDNLTKETREATSPFVERFHIQLDGIENSDSEGDLIGEL